MSMSSKHTKVLYILFIWFLYFASIFDVFFSCFEKRTLEALHPNIACMRHPDHIGAKGVCLPWLLLRIPITSVFEQIAYNSGLTTRRSVFTPPSQKPNPHQFIITQQVVVVDNQRACVGGLDLCFGRWDTSVHPLADVHPTDFSRTLFPGQDYNNARIMDFQDVYNYVSNSLSLLEFGRMPWHDVSYPRFPPWRRYPDAFADRSI
jgi:phospholipase D1/2